MKYYSKSQDSEVELSEMNEPRLLNTIGALRRRIAAGIADPDDYRLAEAQLAEAVRIADDRRWGRPAESTT